MENGVKISQLTEAQSTSDSMYIPVIEANANFKIKVDTLLDSVETGDSFPSGGSVGQVLKKTSTGVEWADDKDTVTTWDNLSGKPQTFTPSLHNHTKSEITDLNKATSSEDGLMSKEDKQKLDTLENVDEYILPKASSTELGGVKVGYNTNAKKYAVQLDGEDKAYVEVPWTDNNTTYNKATTTTDGLMSKEDKLKLDGLGQTGDYVLPVASEQSLGGVKTGYTTSDKNYGVLLDGDSKMYVNVPWTDTNTTYQKATTATDGLMSKEDKAKLDGITDSEDYVLPTASSSTLGGIKTGYSDNDKKYGVKVDIYGKAYVEVPWNDTNTTYENATTSLDGLMSKEDKTKLDSLNQTEEYELPVASNSTLGGIKTGYSTTDKKYALQLDENNNAYVDVPWTDTNTTYTNATSSNAGLMSVEDKNKLDGVKDSATNVLWQSKLQEGVNIGTITINGEPTEVYAPTSGESVADGNTTYTFANGTDGSFTVTPSDGIAQKVTIGKPSTAGTADVANSIEWNNVQSKPSEFTPSSHTHTISNITDFPSNATLYKDGLMSSSDKIKLDGLPLSIEPSKEEIFLINPTTDFEISVGINYIKQEVLTNLLKALSSKIICLNVDDVVYPVTISKSGNSMILSASSITNDSNVNDISAVNLKINTTNRLVTMVTGSSTLDSSGDGTKYLSDDGTYKTVSSSVPSNISVNEIQINRNGQFTFNYKDNTGNYHYTMNLNSSKGLWIYDSQNGNTYRSLYIKPGEAIYPGYSVDYPVDLGKNTADNKFRNCYLSGSVNQSSDICLKENIKPIDAKDNLRLVEFTWKDTKEKGYGAIAQEVEKYYPELVFGEDGLKSVNYIGLHTIKIAQLENEIKELKKQIEILINK